MHGLLAVYRKELADQLGSRRFLILFVLITLAGLSSIYVAAQSIRQEVADSRGAFLLLFTVAEGPLPPFFTFISFLGPLVGLALAFDSINGEMNRGTLSRLLAQPIYRDAVVNGKFLAALTTVAIMLAAIVVIVGALGIYHIGVIPSGEELLRVLVFLVVCILFVGFWLALSTTFSVFLRNTATAALAGIASWIFLTFFVPMIVDTLANAIAATTLAAEPTTKTLVDMENLRQMMSRISPNVLFQEATLALLFPKIRTLGPLLLSETVGMLPTPLEFGASLMLIWPHVVALLALVSVCFAAAYIRFMTQEIRSL